MGNKIISIKDVQKLEKDTVFHNYYKITLKNGTVHYSFINDYPLLRLENYLHMPYSKIASDKVKTQISQDNKNKLPIEMSEITFVFEHDQPHSDGKKRLAVNVRNIYIQDIISYHKLLVHRGAFESMITKVLENKDEIYTEEFQNRFNDERDKFLEILKNKIGKFSKSKL